MKAFISFASYDAIKLVYVCLRCTLEIETGTDVLDYRHRPITYWRWNSVLNLWGKVMF